MAFTTPLDALVERNQNGLLGCRQEWARARLGDGVHVQNGAPFPSEHFNNEARGVPLLRIRDVLRGRTDTWYDGPYDSAFLVEPGDLIIGMDGEFNHSFWAGPTALLNQRVCRLQVDESFFSRRFLYYVLGGYLEAVNAATPSVTVKHLSSRTVADLPLPAPSLEEQTVLGWRLDKQFASVALGEQLLQDALAGCNSLRRSLLHELLDPSHPRVRLSEISEVSVGATPSRKNPDFWAGDIPWVSSGEVAFCRIARTRETISESGLGNRARRLHPPGTVLLAMIGEGKTRGQAAILDVAAAHNQNSAAIRPNPDHLVSEYLYYCLMGMYEQNREAAGGSQQPALNGSLVKAIEIPRLTVAQQVTRVERLNRHLPAIAQLEADLGKQVRRGVALRRAIIRDALGAAHAVAKPAGLVA